MKTSPIILAVSALCFVAAPTSHGADLTDSLLDAPAHASRAQRGGGTAIRAKGLQLASGLQMSGPLNGSGPAPIAVRLSEEDWRKVFPRKDPGK